MAELPRAGVEETDAAVARAKAAFPAWRAVAPGRPRGAAARASPTRSPSAREELATLEARNAGKPIGDARGEIGMVVETFRYYAGAPERLLGETIPVAGGVDMTFREPLGVVGLIVPWNFPLTIASWKVAPGARRRQHGRAEAGRADAADARSSWSGSRSRPACPRACSTWSPGPGSVCGQRLVEHPDVAKIAFTGSTEVGRGIAAGRRADDQAGDARARRQVGQRRLRRRRPRARPRPRRRWRSSATPARTAARARGSSSSARRSTTSWRALERGGRGDRASATRSTRRPRWGR